MYGAFVVWVYAVVFVGLAGYVAWIVKRLRDTDEERRP